MMTAKAPDEPQVYIGENEARPGLVRIVIGSGAGGYDVTPERAERLAFRLIVAADTARAAG